MKGTGVFPGVPRGRISGGAMKAGSLGIADQLIISGVSFLLMVAAARSLGPSAFGVFALLYTVLLTTQPIQESLLTTPFNVLGVTRKGDEYRHYLSSVAILQSALALSFGAVVCVAGIVVIQFDTAVGSMLFALVFAAMGWQYQEFTRRVLYAESRFAAALVNDGITNGLRLALLGLLIARNDLTGDRLFLLLGATWFAGAIVGTWQIRSGLILRPGLTTVRSVAREHWQFGRWLLVTTGVSYVPWYVTTAVMSSVLPTSAYGAYRAFDQLVNGANVLFQTLNNLLRPRLARDARNGPRTMWHTMRPVMLLGGAVLAVFALMLILLQEFLFGLIFGAEYVPFAPAMFLLALTPLALLQKSVLSIALQASRITQPIFTGAVLSAIVQISVSLVVFPVFGLQAAGAPELMGFCTATVFLGWTWKKHIGRENNHLDSPQHDRKSPDSGWPEQAPVRH